VIGVFIRGRAGAMELQTEKHQGLSVSHQAGQKEGSKEGLHGKFQGRTLTLDLHPQCLAIV
jgi:hypothetical protein